MKGIGIALIAVSIFVSFSFGFIYGGYLFY